MMMMKTPIIVTEAFKLSRVREIQQQLIQQQKKQQMKLVES